MIIGGSNLLTKSDVGSYTYAGTGFANPHAPTTINGVSYSYDNAGNLTSKGTQTFTWDAWNRLQETTNAGTSTAYTYDHTGQRVSQSINRGSGTTTTIYWSKLYQTEGSTTTLSIFLPDGTLLATVEGNGSATTTSIIHTDHLNSVALTSDKNGTLSELSAYYPYGAHRITDLPSSGANVQRGYIGQYEDAATTLSYLQARYYDGTRGQFLSQDPILTGVPGLKFLLKPQALNSYAYSENNPINKLDPSGLFNIQTGLVEWGDTAVSIGNQLNASYGPQYGVHFTRQGLLDFNGGKEPVEGQYYGFSIDLGNISNVGGGFYQGGGFAESSAPIAEALVFNGSAISYYNQEDPSQNRSWSGVSGRSENWQHSASEPIAEGVWRVNPQRTEYYDQLPWEQKAASHVGKGLWPGGLTSWGEARTELSDITNGQANYYTGYYIHGGAEPGSRGCIDLTDQTVNFHSWLTGELGKQINLYVNY